ncbi:MAG: DUF1846 domain-containing protein [Negativicutes bacterium]|nr:DUF1846 domain-containing protein [Negativicutes bacterium]
MKTGFDHKKYIEMQSKYIIERVDQYDKLYIEFGGKLMADLHAMRVLPGFDPDAKIKLLHHLSDKLEVVICIYSGDIERNKIRSDFGITYEMDVFRMIDVLRRHELCVNSVVVTRYEDKLSTNVFIQKLVNRGIRVYKHTATKGYPTDIDTIVSEEGYGQNDFIETTKSIVVVTGPGPSSGKLATCLSQMYHESKRGKEVGYAKFETFPVWNLPLKHPVNIAYEAATADLKDINMIDSFHLDAYGEKAVNYNRDIEVFPVLKRIIEKITGKKSNYLSPTDMGVNQVKIGIADDETVQEAARQEIIRRYFATLCDYKKGLADYETVERVKLLLNELDLNENDRVVVGPARNKAKLLTEKNKLGDKNCEEIVSVTAIELSDGEILTGKSSSFMSAPAAAILNAIKYLANLPDSMHLLSPLVLKPILDLKKEVLAQSDPSLNLEEVIFALSICGATNPAAHCSIEKLAKLRNCQVHSTTLLQPSDEKMLRKLGVQYTCDPNFPSAQLFYNN